ncbi:MAG TPA: hypothetical protein VEC35_10725 [Noviherbaspirillum sp.]|nr:hypothetical protein [Noviherbaspirillum sp.]
MGYVVILLITALNGVVLYFLSFLAVGGDGSAEGIHRVWLFGFPWVAIFGGVSIALHARGKSSTAIKTASLTLPAGYVAALVGMFAAGYVTSLRSNSPEFDLACKTAGSKILAKPATAVESIAYDWEPGTYPPNINYFTIDSRGNVRNLRGGIPRFPGSIKFVEGRCCQFEGAPTNRVRPFIRRPNGGDYYGIPELTADVLVQYKVAHSRLQGMDTSFKTVDITVTDRRDGRTLATLRYLLDMEGRRGCGATSDGVMDEQQFVRSAVGMD